MSFGKQSSSQQQQSTSNQALDPQIKAALLGNYANQQKFVGQQQPDYTGQLVAPMNGLQQQGLAGLANVGASGTGLGALNQGTAAAGGVAGFNAPQVTAGQLSGTDLSPYMNPYTGSVINTTLADLSRQNQIANVANDSAATSAGAFGGDRGAVQDALTNEAYARTGAQTLANLNQANFGQAQGAAQQDIANQLAAAQGNQAGAISSAGLRLGAGQQLAAMGGQQLSQQQALQSLIFGAGNTAQQQAQNQLTAAQGQFQTNLGNRVTLQQLINQALGLAGNPVLTQSQSTGTGHSSGFNIGLPSSSMGGGSGGSSSDASAAGGG